LHRIDTSSDEVVAEKVRTAVATHIPREVMDGRLLDLEEEVRGLRESLRFYQQR